MWATVWCCVAFQRLRDDGTVQDRDLNSVSREQCLHRIYADMAKLFLQDLVNVERGIYPCRRTMTEQGIWRRLRGQQLTIGCGLRLQFDLAQ